jgi:hypothetical protein
VGLWTEFYKWPLPTLPLFIESATGSVKEWFFHKGTPWNLVYEFVEFIGNIECEDLQPEAERFRLQCNIFLERENSAYRFVGKTISPITNEAEIKAIEQAARTDHSLLRPVSIHIETALKLFSDKKQPDYRNSMKESISAVEALAKIIAKNDKATLAPALDAIAKKVRLHPSLQAGLKSLYAYTSDDDGIRHALKDDGEPEPEDAKYFLVSCSAFVNYLTEKARKNGLLP